MRHVLAGLLVTLSAATAGCSSENSEPSSMGEPSAVGEVSSVVELRDALVAAGYECAAWEQENVVNLAAESGACDESSVLSTFASEGDLQAQLDLFRESESLFTDAGVEPDPMLVGANWIFRSLEAPAYADELGGTVVR